MKIFDDPIFYLFLLQRICCNKMSYYLVACLVLLSPVLADKPSSDYGAPAKQESYAPSVKYGGPIVYSGEKPPIIHFPPPPEKVSLIDSFSISHLTVNLEFFFFTDDIIWRRIRIRQRWRPTCYQVCAPTSPRLARVDLHFRQPTAHPCGSHTQTQTGLSTTQDELSRT